MNADKQPGLQLSIWKEEKRAKHQVTQRLWRHLGKMTSKDQIF